MPKLFGVDIAGILNREMGKGLLPATLLVITPGTRTTARTAGTQPKKKKVTCRGFISSYEEARMEGALILEEDKKVSLLGASFSTKGTVPKKGDKITIEGATYDIIKVTRDPAAAVYNCQSRL